MLVKIIALFKVAGKQSLNNLMENLKPEHLLKSGQQG